MSVLRESPLPNLLYRGKVRDTHSVDEDSLLMIATDRISAFDVVLPTAIPEKGAVLNQISSFWFEKTAHIIPNHFLHLASTDSKQDLPIDVARRGMIVRNAERIDIECIVRGYITGSALSEYKKTGLVNGESMPDGLQDGDMFPTPLFTPTTKADEGHDENMSIAEVEEMGGKDLADKLAEVSISVYEYARDFATQKGIIIADTKMEFGLIDGKLHLIDELLTPDSSRFWNADEYSPGKSQPSYDKQFVRDWLDTQGWDHEPPAPELPDDVVNRTTEKYIDAYNKLTGRQLV